MSALNRFRFAPVLLLLLAVTLGACEYTRPDLRFLITDYRQFSPDALQTIIEEQSPLQILEAEVDGERDPIAAISAREADLALVENTAAFVPGVRAIIPVYKSVLHIAADMDYEPQNLESPLQGASFYVANRSAAGRSFVELVTRRQALSADGYAITNEFVEGETDFIIYSGPINPANTTWMRSGFVLQSLDNQLNPKHRFYEEGISYTAPKLRPRTIPAFTYDLPGNEEPLLTVEVDMLLVTHKDELESTIFELTRVFLEQKPRFVAIAPHLFSGINESFDPLDLNFPLHSGARSYLERDDPGFIERYAETINMLVYVSFLVISALVAFARWRDRVKKDRIDKFYARVLEIRREADGRSDAERLAELDALEQDAYKSLIRERLSANESFRIFTDLLATARSEIHTAGDDEPAPATPTRRPNS